MSTNSKIDNIYMNMAQEWAKMSKATRLKVGCLVVKGDTIISDGYNGTPSGFDNVCEDEFGNTKDMVLHAESNAITKLARSTVSSEGSTLYTTVSPCYSCAKLIIQCRIKKVIYLNEYRDLSGISLLEQAGIEVLKLC